MADAGRVVIRSSWLSILAVLAPAIVAILAIQIWRGSLEEALSALFVLAAMTVAFRFLSYVEPTAQGLRIHTLGAKLVRWQDIGSVENVNRQGGAQLKIYTLPGKRSHWLPAPRGAFGVGKAETAAARDLIEQWWMTYRGLPVTTPIGVEPPRDASGHLIDPWVPPAED